jgi:hypothetical protein
MTQAVLNGPAKYGEADFQVVLIFRNEFSICVVLNSSPLGSIANGDIETLLTW